MPEIYIPWYIDKYGREAFDDMVRRKNKPHRWTEGELEGIEILCKEKFAALKRIADAKCGGCQF